MPRHGWGFMHKLPSQTGQPGITATGQHKQKHALRHCTIVTRHCEQYTRGNGPTTLNVQPTLYCATNTPHFTPRCLMCGLNYFGEGHFPTIQRIKQRARRLGMSPIVLSSTWYYHRVEALVDIQKPWQFYVHERHPP